MSAPSLTQHVQHTRTEVLDSHPALTMSQVAYVLNLNHVRGMKAGLPDRQRAIALVREGSLPLIDPSQPVARWTVSNTNVRRYLSGASTDSGATS